MVLFAYYLAKSFTYFCHFPLVKELLSTFLFFLMENFILFYFIFKSLILTCVPKHEPPSHLPPHNISLGHPHAPAASMLYPASEKRSLLHFYECVTFIQLS